MSKIALLGDDSKVIRQVGAITLRKNGFEVIEAENGKEAIERISGVKLDLVVTDITMPHMDGIELIKRLRAMDDYRFTPIIVLSTLAQDDRMKEGRNAGASGWVYKPVNGPQLMDAIRKFMS